MEKLNLGAEMREAEGMSSGAVQAGRLQGRTEQGKGLGVLVPGSAAVQRSCAEPGEGMQGGSLVE